MTHKIKVDFKLKKKEECCVCLEMFPRQMTIPCNTCKYSSCKTCVEKMTIHDTTDDNYPGWGDGCYWNHTYKITCPMCRQPMVSRVLHLSLLSELHHYADMRVRCLETHTLRNDRPDSFRSGLDWELDWAMDGLGGCSYYYRNKVKLETIKVWTLSQTPLMKRWLNNYLLSDPDIEMTSKYEKND